MRKEKRRALGEEDAKREEEGIRRGGCEKRRGRHWERRMRKDKRKALGEEDAKREEEA